MAIEKFELEKKIESIEHQLAMADYRKTLGETVNLKWEHKARFKSKMLKIELKEMNLRFDYIKKQTDKKNKEEIVKKNMRLERFFLTVVKEQFGEEVFKDILHKAQARLDDHIASQT